ncbi:MAG: PHP domain-containing protein [Chloroflexota bacterium]
MTATSGLDDGRTNRMGRADLHIHTVASDGVSSVVEILDAVAAREDLAVIAITDHERIDAAVAGRSIAHDRGLRTEIVVGEEISTRGGHLLGLFLEHPVKPLRSLRDTIAAVHDQGGIAIPAHPLVPYPLCAQGWVLRRLLDDPDPRVHPDAVEAFNPTFFGRIARQRVVAFATEHGVAMIGSSDAHEVGQVGQGWTEFEGWTVDDLRSAIATRSTVPRGRFHPAGSQVATFARQLRKYGRDLGAEVGGRVRGTGTRRDLGYPTGDIEMAAGDPRPRTPR